MDRKLKEEGQQSLLPAIRAFWHWFDMNSAKLINLHANREFDLLGKAVSSELNTVDKQLAWEIGPGENAAYLFTISSEGDAKLRQIAEMMIQLAPQLADWEFYSARPAREAPGKIRLPGRDVKLDTQSWKFAPVERTDTGRLDVIVIDDQLADIIVK